VFGVSRFSGFSFFKYNIRNNKIQEILMNIRGFCRKIREKEDIIMIEKILEKVSDAMTPHLNDEQIEKLNNVLYINPNYS
jgi:hypothetical protein